jgi:hypothetical protein
MKIPSACPKATPANRANTTNNAMIFFIEKILLRLAGKK